VDGAEFFTALFGSDRFQHLVRPLSPLRTPYKLGLQRLCA
jgi:hypothetical protein